MRLPHRRQQVHPDDAPATQPYPNDPEHPDKPYEEVQRDIGTSLLLGAVVLVVLLVLLVFGLW